MYKGSVAFSAGRGYSDGVRNLEVMVIIITKTRTEVMKKLKLWHMRKILE